MDYSTTEILIGKEKQEMLKTKTVSIIGLSGIGVTAAQILVRNGVNLRIVDKERVYEKEAPRYTTYIEDDINKFKAKQAKKRLEEINSEVKVKSFHEELTKDNVFLLDADVIIDASNNFKTSKIVNNFALSKDIPLIFANHVGRKGHVLVVDRKQNKKGACVECLEEELNIGSIKEDGAYGPTAMMVAALAANAAIKNLIGIENVEQLLVIDALKTEVRHKNVEKKRTCKAGKN
ncbi:ThiF family adenylyltransferase [Candidatus Woesearchaeota archaeon]|nr:ThiF family adenylyltransferase [Candidatus Woesearchaeota archaeon]